MRPLSVEKIIIAIMWVGALITYSVALLNNYELYLSDKIGIAGIVIISGVTLLRKEYTLAALVIVLFIGMLNVASFVYFINIVVTFSALWVPISPGIQAYSLILFFVLVLFRRPLMIEYIKGVFGVSENDKISEREATTKLFMNRFSKLDDAEIEKRLTLDLSEEALLALKQIRQQRKGLPRTES